MWIRVQAAQALCNIGRPAAKAASKILELMTLEDEANDPRNMHQRFITLALFIRDTELLTVLLTALPAAEAGQEYGGVYPHLTMHNDENECGTGAVVPWADRLWIVTYAPHKPMGSNDRLYEITPDLKQIIRPESIGGTPANRMIHRESNQLFIGPHAIDGEGKVRTIPYFRLPKGSYSYDGGNLTRPPQPKVSCGASPMTRSESRSPTAATTNCLPATRRDSLHPAHWPSPAFSRSMPNT